MQSRIHRSTKILIFALCFTGILYYYCFKNNIKLIKDGTTIDTNRLSFLPNTTIVTKSENNSTEVPGEENDEILMKISKEILQMRRKKADERKLFLEIFEYGSFYGVIAPEAECPNLIRLGTIGDGGKWICNPLKLLNPERTCIFYSLGLNNEISFDLELMELTKNQCKHIAVDMDEQRSDIFQQLPYTNFLTGTISHKSNETFDEYTLEDLMTKYNTSTIDILKMDIEGSEHNITHQLIKIEICQILVELHSPDASFKVFYQWLNKMSKAGFYLIHYEINEGTLLACEFTLIHENCLKSYGVFIIKKFLS